MWTEESIDIVTRVWQKQIEGCAMYQVVKKLKGLKYELKELNRSKFCNIENEAMLLINT